jgi:hypothetical protein
MDDYDLGPLTDLSKVNDPRISSSPVNGYFVGERGSAYAQHENGETTGYREPSDKSGTGKKLQPSSTKTLFMEPKAVNALHSWVTDEYIGTQLKPAMDKNGKLSHVEVHSTDDVPRRGIKKGQVLSKIPATTQVAEGLHPVEFHGQKSFVSPVGSKTGKEVHYGSPVKAVIPARGGYGKAMPFFPEGGMRPGQSPSLENPINMKKGGVIKMPEDYSKGSWRLI